MSGPKARRCAACARRIRSHHPRIGVEDLRTGREISYHAGASCQKRAAEELAGRLVAGAAYAVHHHHGAACPDESPGFGCAGGCFSGAPFGSAGLAVN